jgi:hypothetical protein
VYDPDERINKLADKIDNEAPLSRLTLFSPCKVNQSSCCLEAVKISFPVLKLPSYLV